MGIVAELREELFDGGIGRTGVRFVPVGAVVAGRGETVFGAAMGVRFQEWVLRLHYVTLHLHARRDEGPRPITVVPDQTLGRIAGAPAVAGAAGDGRESGECSTQGDAPTLAPHLSIGDHLQSNRLLQ